MQRYRDKGFGLLRRVGFHFAMRVVYALVMCMMSVFAIKFSVAVKDLSREQRRAYFKWSKAYSHTLWLARKRYLWERNGRRIALATLYGPALLMLGAGGTNFPAGLRSRGIPVPSQDDLLTLGDVFFVDSTHTNASDGNDGTSPQHPMATIDAAIGKCTASKKNLILVAPGHVETIAGAAGIACDVAGISIIGIGNGSNRPTVTWTATGSTWTVSAANVTVKNIIVTNTTAASTKLFSVTAAGCLLDKVDYVEGAAIPLQFCLTSAAADQLTITNCDHRAATAGASAQLWIQLVGTDDTVIDHNTFMLTLQNGATTATINATTAVVRCVIRHNTIVQLGGTTQVSAILMVSASTGVAHDNRVAANVTNIAGTIALASLYGHNNYVTRTVNKSGILDPVVDS